MLKKNKHQDHPAPPNASVLPGSGEKGPSGGKVFPIVGIGASAGGLAAFEAFFSAMPADAAPDMSFVLVQHLAPDHKSILADLVKRYTRMKVYEVSDGMAVAPNCAYIIPPNRNMAFVNGTLQLLEPDMPRGLRLPIDFFFRSLAADQRERAICIVLSGTGSDGCLGVRAIKAEGGMVMVQSPESTEFDGMPQSAIATGLVDYVLPPAEMPAQLIAYAAHAFGKKAQPLLPPAPRGENELKKIFILLRAQTGHDFSLYKPGTINRRVERRMTVHQIERLDGYVRFLQQNPVEVAALFRDLLIGVTSFFRDGEAFKAFDAHVVKRLFDGRNPGAPVRAWVPGCSTGEEAYSIAILLQEQAETMKQSFMAQIFATDIDGDAVEKARTGLYPSSIAADVSPERLDRFFSQGPDGSLFRVHKSIRDMLIFSTQDVVKDPPFSKLDLISCRNLMIYMGDLLQKKIIPLFHYALKPGGYLWLGTSESIGEFTNLFTALDRKSKLYRRKEDGAGECRPGIGRFLVPHSEGRTVPGGKGKAPAETRPPLREIAERELLLEFAAVGALVNQRGDILYLHGHAGNYLEPAQGEASVNILKMAREGLQQDLTVALRKAATRKEPVRHTGLRVKSNGQYAVVNLMVRPVGVGEKAVGADMYLVVFEKAAEEQPGVPFRTPGEDPVQGAGEGAAEQETRIKALCKELREKEEYLQAALEEMETSNEELKSSNEEMQSVNEELQSTNEELETSKEELQSVNEELATVNAELQQKVIDLSRVNNDMSNLLAGTGIGTVFVDLQLRILRFTPAVTQVINLIATDVGRPVGHIASNLEGYDSLVADVQAVLDSLVPREAEVKTRTGAYFLLRIRPYRTMENVIEGAVVTFTDVTELKKAREALRESASARRLAVVVRDANDAITVHDLTGRFLAWNPAAERMYGWSEAEALAMNIRDLIPEDIREQSPAIINRVAETGVLEPYRTRRVARDGRIVEVSLTATALKDESGKIYAIATTERKKAEKARS